MLALLAQLLHSVFKVLTAIDAFHLHRHIAFHHFAAAEVQSCFKALHTVLRLALGTDPVLAQGFLQQGVTILGRWRLLAAHLLPVLLFRFGDAVLAIRLADQVALLKVPAGFLNLGFERIAIHPGVKHHGDVALGDGHLIDELQQADGLGYGHRQSVAGLGADVADLASILRVDVVALQVVDPIERDERPQAFIGQAGLGIGEEFLGELDNCPVGTAELLAGAPGEAKTETT